MIILTLTKETDGESIYNPNWTLFTNNSLLLQEKSQRYACKEKIMDKWWGSPQGKININITYQQKIKDDNLSETLIKQMSNLKVRSQSFHLQCEKTQKLQNQLHTAKQVQCCSLDFFKTSMNNSNTYISKEKSNFIKSYTDYVNFFTNIDSGIKKLSLNSIHDEEIKKKLLLDKNEIEIERMSDCYYQMNRNRPLRNAYYYNPLAPLPS